MARLPRMAPRLTAARPVLIASSAVTPVRVDPATGQRRAWADKGSRHERGYDAAWVRTTKRILKRDNYLCQECLRQGRMTPLKVRPRDHAVDHIIPKAQGGGNEDSNLQSLCAPCHDAKTARERRY